MRLVWTIWTSMSAVVKKAVKLSHSLTAPCRLTMGLDSAPDLLDLVGGLLIVATDTDVSIWLICHHDGTGIL